MKEFKFPSSSSPKIYTTMIGDNGLLSCDCPGWTVKKLGKVRECKHTKKVALDEGLILEERDGQWFVVNAERVVVSAGLQVSTSNPAPSQVTSVANPGAQTQGITVTEAPLPSGFINPMLASAMPEGKDADSFGVDPRIEAIMRGGLRAEWIMEEKFDGHRIIVRVSEETWLEEETRAPKKVPMIVKTIKAWSRLGNSRTLPDHIHKLMLDMPSGVYDGELIVPGSQHSYSVTAGQNSGTEALVLFDMLEIGNNHQSGTNQESLMKYEFHYRRQMLEIAIDALDGDKTISIAQQFTPSLAKVQEIWDRGGEGAIIKKLSAKYSPGWRTPDWVKVKAELSATLTITGFKAGKNGPYSIVELRDDHGIETTVKTLNNAMMLQFQQNPTAYLGKRLVISYHERMPKGKYRHPMFDHLAGVGE